MPVDPEFFNDTGDDEKENDWAGAIDIPMAIPVVWELTVGYICEVYPGVAARHVRYDRVVGKTKRATRISHVGA